jgi:hypothetical protein
VSRVLRGYIGGSRERGPDSEASRTGTRYVTAVLTNDLVGHPYGDSLDLVLWKDGRWSLVQREYGTSQGTTLAEGSLHATPEHARVSVTRKWADGTVSTESECHDTIAEQLARDENLATITVTTTDGRTAVYTKEGD